ncbi:maltose acetyltransferase domain-containing protein [Alteromonas sp. 14N.309.X.WAT.G.H12]|uniref:maltose acetyltransferase domain-containing protein n=1 Tax=Alteromonas sp. 14N.309.X.WAT.G.H12 TaxID=3120824 RepID=UPI002FD6B805
MHTQTPDWENNPAFKQMISAQWYCTQDPQLKALRTTAKRRCYALNNSASDDKALLSSLLPQVSDVKLGEHFHCDYGFQIICHGFFTAGDFLTILDGATVKIGQGCKIGNGVVISTVSHHESPTKRFEGWQQAFPVVIGDNVTIGNGATILPGARISDNQVIPDGTVVSSNRFYQSLG